MTKKIMKREPKNIKKPKGIFLEVSKFCVITAGGAGFSTGGFVLVWKKLSTSSIIMTGSKPPVQIQTNISSVLTIFLVQRSLVQFPFVAFLCKQTLRSSPSGADSEISK
jgi:hypothetical protein